MNRKAIITIVLIVVVGLVVGAATAAILNGSENKNVTYHANGGHHMGDISKSSDIVSDSSTAIPEAYVKDNMQQFGWNTQADGNGKEVKAGDKIPSDVKDLYACYSQYMILYYSTGESITHIEDVTVTLSDGGKRLDNPVDLGQCCKITELKFSMQDTISKLTFKDSKAKSVSVYHDDILKIDELKFQYDGGALYIMLSFKSTSNPQYEFSVDKDGNGLCEFVPRLGTNLEITISASYHAD